MSMERLMLDHSPSMMLLVEPTQLRIVMANRGASQTLGYPEEALLAMTITDIESSLQDVFYWEDVRNGQYHDDKCDRPPRHQWAQQHQTSQRKA